MPSPDIVPTSGQRYRFTLRSGAVIIGIFRGRMQDFKGRRHIYVIQTLGKNGKGYTAGYNHDQITSIEDA